MSHVAHRKCGLILMGAWIALAPTAPAASPAATVITFKIVKQAPGMCQKAPQVSLLSAAGEWTIRRPRTWSGENTREIFFTVEAADPRAELPRMAVKAPGVVPMRVIVGKRDAPFTRQGDNVAFTLVRDTRNAMPLAQVLSDPEGGLPIHIDHTGSFGRTAPSTASLLPKSRSRPCSTTLLYDPFTGLGRPESEP